MSSQDKDVKKKKNGGKDKRGGLMTLCKQVFFFLFFLYSAVTSEQLGRRSWTPASTVQTLNPFSVLAQERSLDPGLPAGTVTPHAARNPGQVSIIWQKT